MDTQHIKEYLKSAFELEGALYKHQKLVDAYVDSRIKNVPQEPIKQLPPRPAPPVIEKPKINLSWRIAFYSCSFVLGAIFCLLSAIMNEWIILLMGGFFVLIGFGAIGLTASDKKHYEKQYQEYERIQKAYELEQENYKKHIAIVEQNYLYNHNCFLQYSKEYDDETARQLADFKQIETKLRIALTELYSKNLIYAKYRNLVAIATIYEYFDSGRCTQLEGPNGAYNMYEGELRSSIIIASLAQIISDLDQIKHGQYALYEQINRSNQEICSLLNNINDTQKLTAYYAEAAAIAASADRITVGMIW